VKHVSKHPAGKAERFRASLVLSVFLNFLISSDVNVTAHGGTYTIYSEKYNINYLIIKGKPLYNFYRENPV
jgi:hypothetical protein